tara:strand:- start:35 stop:823 length:789 start_codon:yes stop_codon:yes gene_type:complete
MSRAVVDVLGEVGGKAMKILKGVDDLGPNKNIKMTPEDTSAYIEYGKRYHAEHGSMKGHMKVNYLGDEFSLKKNKDGPDGEVNLKTRNKKVKDKENAVRAYNEKKGFDAIQDEQNRLGRPQEETDQIIKDAKKGNRALEKQLRKDNKGKADKDKDTVGHIRAVGRKGSLDVPENRMRENASENYANQNKRDPDDLNIRMAGAPDNETTYIKQLQLANEFGPEMKLSNLPDHIRRKILAAKDSDEIDDIIQAYEASKRRKKRK